MFYQLLTNRDKSADPPPAHPGAPPGSESTRQPLPPGTLYKPYSEAPGLPEPRYKPYAEKPVAKSPYEPYKGI